MFDERLVLRMHYDEAGSFIGGELIEPQTVTSHVHYRDVALASAVPFTDYWAGHPRYWRRNWRDSPA